MEHWCRRAAASPFPAASLLPATALHSATLPLPATVTLPATVLLPHREMKLCTNCSSFDYIWLKVTNQLEAVIALLYIPCFDD